MRMRSAKLGRTASSGTRSRLRLGKPDIAQVFFCGSAMPTVVSMSVYSDPEFVVVFVEASVMEAVQTVFVKVPEDA